MVQQLDLRSIIYECCSAPKTSPGSNLCERRGAQKNTATELWVNRVCQLILLHCDWLNVLKSDAVVLFNGVALGD